MQVGKTLGYNMMHFLNGVFTFRYLIFLLFSSISGYFIPPCPLSAKSKNTVQFSCVILLCIQMPNEHQWMELHIIPMLACPLFDLFKTPISTDMNNNGWSACSPFSPFSLVSHRGHQCQLKLSNQSQACLGYNWK